MPFYGIVYTYEIYKQMYKIYTRYIQSARRWLAGPSPGPRIVSWTRRALRIGPSLVLMCKLYGVIYHFLACLAKHMYIQLPFCSCVIENNENRFTQLELITIDENLYISIIFNLM